MLSLPALAALAAGHPAALEQPVRPVRIGGLLRDLDADPLIMGVVNLSRDSTYRDSVAVSPESAVRRARIMAAQGAGIIDIGAESTTARAERVTEQEQIAALVPVIEQVTAAGVDVSVESYSPAVLRSCLAAGATVVNLTGSADLDRIYPLAAEYGAAVVMCFLPGATARDIGDVPLAGDPVPMLLDYFADRLEHARARGVTEVIIDPGLGFYYGNLTDPSTRVRYQTELLINSFRFRALGVPICQAMPHAFDLFEEEFRTAEGFFALLSALGRVNVYRTHEVARVRAVLNAVRVISDPLPG